MAIEENDNLPQGETGRQIVVVDRGASASVREELARATGGDLTYASDVEELGATEATNGGAAVVLDELGMAIVSADAAQVEALQRAAADAGSAISSVEPEVYVQALGGPDVAQRAPLPATTPELGHEDASDDVDPAASYADTDTATWGLYAVGAVPPLLHTTPWTGTGTTIAVLDTGLDLTHPDFAGRVVDSATFVPGQAVQDGHSHGTHCAGTAAGPRVPAGGGRRYGVAYGAGLLVGKVLGNDGGGTSGQVLAGLNWAITKGATVVSMSLGSGVAAGQLPYAYYEEAGLRALQNGVLVVAAAGNSGWAPVGSPANGPSVLAVAALDQDLQRATFSCVGLNGAGGEVNVAAPGVATYSAVPVSMGSHGYKSGTSMATPHAAGVAAMLAHKTGKRGLPLWNELMLTTRNLAPLGAVEVGYGLVQAPIRRIVLTPVPFPRKPLAAG